MKKASGYLWVKLHLIGIPDEGQDGEGVACHRVRRAIPGRKTLRKSQRAAKDGISAMDVTHHCGNRRT